MGCAGARILGLSGIASKLSYHEIDACWFAPQLE
jgi:hypothetical protein